MNKKSVAFINLLEKHKGILHKIANTYCKSLDDREDLLQEMAIQLWLSFENYDNQYQLSTFVYRIAFNTAISFYRKDRNKKEKTVAFSAVFETTIEVEKQFEEEPRIKQLQQYIQDLKEIDKALIFLYLEELSYKEISNIMGLSPTNVSTKISRIKKLLKKKFDQQKINYERY